MLDAFIIDRIRRERARREDGHIPLRVEIPVPEPPRSHGEPNVPPDELDDPERGSAIIEDTL